MRDTPRPSWRAIENPPVVFRSGTVDAVSVTDVDAVITGGGAGGPTSSGTAAANASWIGVPRGNAPGSLRTAVIKILPASGSDGAGRGPRTQSITRRNGP